MSITALTYFALCYYEFINGICRKLKWNIILYAEEYETIRLVDLEGPSQEQCGKYMCIAKTTVQQIPWEAPKRPAEA